LQGSGSNREREKKPPRVRRKKNIFFTPELGGGRYFSALEPFGVVGREGPGKMKSTKVRKEIGSRFGEECRTSS